MNSSAGGKLVIGLLGIYKKIYFVRHRIGSFRYRNCRYKLGVQALDYQSFIFQIIAINIEYFGFFHYSKAVNF